MDIVTQALLYAAEKHAGQYRDGDHPLPYICHPVEVMVNLRNVGGVTDPQMLAAAVLHDVLEECDVTGDELERTFGKQVAIRVLAVTRREPTAEETRGMDDEERWTLRSGMLLEEIRHMDPQDQTIKLADRLSNVREANRTKKGKKLARYQVQTKEILKIISKEVNPGLWRAVKAALNGPKV